MKQLRMVFPDDPNVLDWGKNRNFAEDIRSKLDIGPLTDNNLFPVGTMFWARVAALDKLFNYGFKWEDYPVGASPL